MNRLFIYDWVRRMVKGEAYCSLDMVFNCCWISGKSHSIVKKSYDDDCTYVVPRSVVQGLQGLEMVVLDQIWALSSEDENIQCKKIDLDPFAEDSSIGLFSLKFYHLVHFFEYLSTIGMLPVLDSSPSKQFCVPMKKSNRRASFYMKPIILETIDGSALFCKADEMAWTSIHAVHCAAGLKNAMHTVILLLGSFISYGLARS